MTELWVSKLGRAERTLYQRRTATLSSGKGAANALVAKIDDYAQRMGIDLTPHHEALNLAMAISLLASTSGVGLLPLNARNLLPPAVVSRPLAGAPPMIDLALGNRETNPSPVLKLLLSKADDLKFRVDQTRSPAR